MTNRKPVWILAVSLSSGLLGCSATYKGVVKPVGKIDSLSPDLFKFSDATIEARLKANPRLTFPTTLAVAKLARPSRPYYYRAEPDNSAPYQLETSPVPKQRAGAS